MNLNYMRRITILTDNLNSKVYSLPEGIARWTRPSTQPLNEIWKNKFRSTDIENHHDLISEAKRNYSLA